MPSTSSPVPSPASHERAALFPQRFGRFVLLKEIGHGGMGQVFMAASGQTGLERVCALKIIKDIAGDRDNEDLGQRFMDEAKVVTKLSHENLVYVFDFGIVRAQGYLAMEYVQGKTLTEVWNRCAQRGVGFPLGVSLFLVCELCAGLGYAHQVGGLGLVHRDVSPSNVMLSYTGGIKLIDFGLAKWKSKVAQTATGINWGKMSYMSPEQYIGRALDRRSDLFSAGVILWELLTGRQLFPSSGARARDPQIVPPSKINGNLFPELDAVVMKALAVDPADRYQTGEEMSAAIAAHLPRESGKLEVGEFLRSIFEVDLEKEREAQERLVTSASSAVRDGAVPEPANDGRSEAMSTSSATDPLLGSILGERYYVRRMIGEGAMGRVYEGHHTGVGKRVAIKVPRRPERRRAELLQRFRMEANAASQIGHANIADVTDCGNTPDGNFFFVMEFIDGIDLEKFIRREGALPLERALLIALQIARALEAAHKAAIIHRDLKPSNVMLVRGREERDFVKVLDFGVAKFLRNDDLAGDAPANLTLTDAAVGTPRYMAPEQIETGRSVDFRADIYALGGLLFYMLSGGHAPHEGESVENVWRKKMVEDPTPLQRWRSDLPPQVEALVMRCLARDPVNRPSSMDELKRELLRAEEALRVAGSSVLGMRAPSATTVLAAESRASVSRKRRRTLFLVGSVAAATLLGAFQITAMNSSDRARRAAAGRPAEPPPPPNPVVDLDQPKPPVIAHAPPPAPVEPTPPAPVAVLPAPSETKPVVTAAPPLRPARPAADQAKIFYEQAYKQFQEENHTDAERLAQLALNSKPTPELKVRTLLLLGNVYRAAEKNEQAAATYERVLKLDPSNTSATANLAKTRAGLENR